MKMITQREHHSPVSKKTQSDSTKQEKNSPPSLQHTSTVMEEHSFHLNFTVMLNNTTYCVYLWECFLRRTKTHSNFSFQAVLWQASSILQCTGHWALQGPSFWQIFYPGLRNLATTRPKHWHSLMMSLFLLCVVENSQKVFLSMYNLLKWAHS